MTNPNPPVENPPVETVVQPRVLAFRNYNNRPIPMSAGGMERSVEFVIGANGYLECFETLTSEEIEAFDNSKDMFLVVLPSEEFVQMSGIPHGNSAKPFLDSLTTHAIPFLENHMDKRHHQHELIKTRLLMLKVQDNSSNPQFKDAMENNPEEALETAETANENANIANKQNAPEGSNGADADSAPRSPTTKPADVVDLTQGDAPKADPAAGDVGEVVKEEKSDANDELNSPDDVKSDGTGELPKVGDSPSTAASTEAQDQSGNV